MTITSITLENFQTIAEPTRIEFSELVMLFGPNSSGKSAISDALALAVALCQNDLEDQDASSKLIPNSKSLMSIPDVDVTDTDPADPLEKFHFITPESVITRYWRRTKDGFAPSMKLSVSGSTGSSDWAWYFEWSLDEKAVGSTDARLVASTARRAVIFQYEGVELFRIESESPKLFTGDLEINLKHSWLEACADEVAELIELLKSPSENFSGWAEILEPESTLFCAEMLWDIDRSRQLSVHRYTEALKDSPEVLRCGNLIQSLFERMNELILLVGAQVSPPHEVSDSRKIPTPKDLTYLFGEDWEEFDRIRVGVYIPNLYVDADPAFWNIATGFALKLDKYWVDDLHRVIYSTRELDGVNRLLSDFIFLDKGYQIDCEHVYLISESEAAHLMQAPNDNVCGQLLVKLCLRDANQNKFDFTEVGSGLGYCLPVLAALCNEEPLAIIRQPELHLHPALQASMGDAILQSATATHRLLIETHSEHMTLRILRRIRQVSQGKANSSDYPCAQPEMVRVYYFEPRADDTTKVHHLRVSKEGDFLDPWPNGFFEERYEDLFDE